MMMYELGWTYACNVVINSLLSFATTSLLVLGGLTLFRVRDPRTRAIVLAIPLLKLVVDFFLYNFSDWALVHKINPMEAEPGSRTLMMWLSLPATTGIQLLTSNGKTFTLADMMTLSMNPGWVKLAVAIVGSITCCFVVAWLGRLSVSIRHYREILSTAKRCSRPVYNLDLDYNVHKARIVIMTSSMVSVPCALGLLKKYIIFPETLVAELSQAEYEAIVAHEYNHLCWYDAFVRLCADFLGRVFWWVPTRWCLARIEQLQEYACDRKAVAKGVAPVDLAAAIFKSAKFAKQQSLPCLCAYFVDKHSMSKRVSRLLAEPRNQGLTFVRWVQYVVLGASMSLILLGKFWIF